MIDFKVRYIQNGQRDSASGPNVALIIAELIFSAASLQELAQLVFSALACGYKNPEGEHASVALQSNIYNTSVRFEVTGAATKDGDDLFAIFNEVGSLSHRLQQFATEVEAGNAEVVQARAA